MRNLTVPVQPNPWAELETRCRADARDYVTDAGVIAAARRREAGKYPTEAGMREAQVSALTDLVGSVMAKNAMLVARVERLERGWWARLKGWWRS